MLQDVIRQRQLRTRKCNLNVTLWVEVCWGNVRTGIECTVLIVLISVLSLLLAVFVWKAGSRQEWFWKHSGVLESHCCVSILRQVALQQHNLTNYRYHLKRYLVARNASCVQSFVRHMTDDFIRTQNMLHSVQCALWSFATFDIVFLGLCTPKYDNHPVDKHSNML